MLIRDEEENDQQAIHALHTAAFEASAEAHLVDALRERARPVISLVAVDSGTVVGHILFSPVRLTGHADLRIMGLAPLAVVPRHQRRGIGSDLVRAGVERCRQLGFGAVVVLGHPEYYPRFGFLPAARFSIACEYDVPEEAFMAMELAGGYLSERTGTIEYHAAFSELSSEKP